MKTAEYFHEWLEDEKLNLQRSTFESYKTYLDRHIIAYFEEQSPILENITARHIKDYINYIKTGGRLDGKQGGLSQASIRKHLSVLKQALKDAVVLGYIEI